MAGPIRISILANGRQARQEATLTARAYSGLGRSIVKGGAALGLTGLIYKAGQFTAASVNLEARFSQTMSLIGAATKAPAAELDGLSQLALKLGADTSFSANEAADAMLELAKSGLTTKQIMGGGVQATLQLAAAGGTELGTAATIASNAMNAFNIAGRDAKSVAAALAGGANASSASVESLGQALSQVGPGAVNAGFSLQDTVAALSAFDAAGIKGSDAGTSLKTMLANLVPQTAKADAVMDSLGLSFVKANGEFVSLESIAGQLKSSLGGLSAAQRTTALNTLFGSDASRAATVLMREGTDGIRKYIKATNDQGAAQKMAEARMSGTAGTLERLSGAVETAQLRLGQELAPVVEKVGTGLADNVVPAMDSVIDGAKKLGDAVAPAVSEISEALGDLIPSADEAGSVFNDKLVPAVKGLADIVGGVVGFINDLPGPIKEIGIQAGIAAFVLPRLAATATAAGTSMRNASVYARVLFAELRDGNTRASTLAGGLSKLGGAARNAAGIGGMVALAQGASRADEASGLLLTTLGGAATGFSLGGPIGALIGGGGAGLLGIAQAASQAKDAGQAMRESYSGLADTLDQVTGATTAATRAFIYDRLERDGTLAALEAEGLSRRTVVAAVAGEQGARAKLTGVLASQSAELDRTNSKLEASRRALADLNSAEFQGEYVDPDQKKALEDQVAALEDTAAAQKKVIDTVQGGLGAVKADTEATRKRAIATGALGDALKGVSKRGKVVTRIEAKGYPETARAVARVTRGLKLTPKQIRTVIQATGAKASVADVQRVLRSMKNADRTKANPKVTVETRRAQADIRGFLTSLTGNLGKARKNADQGGKQVQDGVEKGPKQARADLGTFNSGLTSGLGRARETSASGGRSIGSAMSSGVAAGVSASPIIGAMVGAVAAGIAAAKARARIKSPSRVMRDEVGVMLVRGLVDGVNRKKPGAQKAGRGIIDRLLKGVEQGSDGVRGVIERLTKLVGDKLDGKKQAGRRKALLKSLDDERKRLLRNGKAQDANTRKLEKATSAYKQLKQEAKQYATAITDGVVTYGSVVGLGTINGGSTVTLSALLSQLTARAGAAEEYAALVKQLAKDGLNKTSVQQLLDAGVEGGLATAQAIASGGAAAVADINRLTDQLAGTGKSLAEKMRQRYYGAGLRAGEGLVKGLTKKQRELDRVAERLATSMVKQIRRALGIKSPSRVFRQIGEQTVAGLNIGLDDTTGTRRRATDLAKATITGFGTPALDAYMRAPGTAAPAAPFSLRLQLTSTQVSQLERGKAIDADLSFFYDHGGRPKVKQR